MPKILNDLATNSEQKKVRPSLKNLGDNYYYLWRSATFSKFMIWLLNTSLSSKDRMFTFLPFFGEVSMVLSGDFLRKILEAVNSYLGPSVDSMNSAKSRATL